MVIRIDSFSYENDWLFKYALNIRTKVFVDEIGVDKFLEFDGLDYDATHYLVTVDSGFVATARYRELSEGIKIERFAVLPPFRHKGIGVVLIRKVIEDVLPSKMKIYLHAQEKVVNFYLLNGFKVEGERFQEANINHFKMIYQRK